MFFKIYLPALATVFSLSCLLNTASYALSCAPPMITAQSLENTPVVFEGNVVESRALNSAEKQKLVHANVGFKGGDLSHVKIYVFTVTKAWKGAKQGAEIKVLRNTYWGDGFASGHTYIVLPQQQVSDMYRASLCGPSFNLSYVDQADWSKTAYKNVQEYFRKTK